MIKINGELLDQAEGKSLSAYLSECGYKREMVAVERNGKIVPKSEYDDTVLWDNDEVEIVSFVGGG
ncbi:sulfur carrier protein ThiS [Qiania dongpingensis]|uniref:Sulfur carrier protein ThiS n=1 Tax=Qiania dongpingensis TaxID=2763669 RepID=A0A7G9G566_9FIRM|nr:sulfur carrier protein ThiS [Qiania dongpingensis]QNM05948.1 sulfur carrier protein ThiS [Qiania dongpingensis]